MYTILYQMSKGNRINNFKVFVNSKCDERIGGKIETKKGRPILSIFRLSCMFIPPCTNFIYRDPCNIW